MKTGYLKKPKSIQSSECLADNSLVLFEDQITRKENLISKGFFLGGFSIICPISLSPSLFHVHLISFSATTLLSLTSSTFFFLSPYVRAALR